MSKIEELIKYHQDRLVNANGLTITIDYQKEEEIQQILFGVLFRETHKYVADEIAKKVNFVLRNRKTFNQEIKYIRVTPSVFRRLVNENLNVVRPIENEKTEPRFMGYRIYVDESLEAEGNDIVVKTK